MVLTQAGVGLDSVDHDPDTGRYRAEYDGSTVPPSLALIAALSTAMEADPIDIDPLYESVDPDALDGLLGNSVAATGPVEITLSVEDYDATVSSTGTILLDPQSDDGSDGGIAPEQPS